MKEKITNLLGGKLIFEINFPPEIKDKEEIQTKRVIDLIGKLLRKEFDPPEEDIANYGIK